MRTSHASRTTQWGQAACRDCTQFTVGQGLLVCWEGTVWGAVHPCKGGVATKPSRATCGTGGRDTFLAASLEMLQECSMYLQSRCHDILALK
jgi:hypothetical protein